MSVTAVSVCKVGYISRHNGVLVDYAHASYKDNKAIVEALTRAVRRVQSYCTGGLLVLEVEALVLERYLLNFTNLDSRYRKEIAELQSVLELCDATIKVQVKRPAQANSVLKTLHKEKGVAKVQGIAGVAEEYSTADSLLKDFAGVEEVEDEF